MVGFILMKVSSRNQSVSPPKNSTSAPEIHSIGEMRPAFFHRDFEFLDEQTLATDFGERAIEDLVALGCHAENDNFRAGI